MRPRVTMVLAIVAVLLGGVMLVPAAYARLSGGSALASIGGIGGGENVPAPAPTTPPPPTLAAGPVSVDFKGKFFSWALMDRKTGEISGAQNMTATNSTESMMKAWIVSDYLRQLGDKPLSATRKKQIVTAIRDSNDISAESLYNAGGRRPVLERLIKMCKLTDTKIEPTKAKWAYTQMSPQDAVRMGDCIGDGTAAGRKWTGFVLSEMTKVRGDVEDQQTTQGGGRWGIIDGLPDEIKAQGPVSIKNGFTMLWADVQWHVNCLAVTDKWTLAVMMRYPQKLGLAYGAKVCASVTTQLVTPQPGAALKVPQQPVGKL
ncbi:hypothetical protein U2F26_21480 [Micromonospora sp. 4G57]|uniref:Serine hydrolase n=1 Tax=Micromonospora sicca TaxID=2202420 RepID=A0ABU5JER7_9ACTN|nr:MULTISPECIES: hypothetical protein [unclassified Micromonospora]MDZ5445271.1 hypothetical protein [Micromonospora sp. 4G57]MDZ5491086.1 hypothetical protein [Micromonospora sp. 4G53]